MEITVVSEEENPMLHRTDVTFRVSHVEATPDRLAVRDSLAARLNKDADEVVIRKLDTKFGMRTTYGEAKVYESPAEAKEIEQGYMLARNKIAVGEDGEVEVEADAAEEAGEPEVEADVDEAEEEAEPEEAEEDVDEGEEEVEPEEAEEDVDEGEEEVDPEEAEEDIDEGEEEAEPEGDESDADDSEEDAAADEADDEETEE